ncbi:MAG: Tripartite tricarboxylate transporter TctB family, partial [uncultured Rubrobacteraceae bacterium]
ERGGPRSLLRPRGETRRPGDRRSGRPRDGARGDPQGGRLGSLRCRAGPARGRGGGDGRIPRARFREPDGPGTGIVALRHELGAGSGLNLAADLRARARRGLRELHGRGAGHRPRGGEPRRVRDPVPAGGLRAAVSTGLYLLAQVSGPGVLADDPDRLRGGDRRVLRAVYRAAGHLGPAAHRPLL